MTEEERKARRHGRSGSTSIKKCARDEARRGHSVKGPALVKSALSAGRGIGKQGGG